MSRPYLENKSSGSYLHWLFKKDVEVLIDEDKKKLKDQLLVRRCLKEGYIYMFDLFKKLCNSKITKQKQQIISTNPKRMGCKTRILFLVKIIYEPLILILIGVFDLKYNYVDQDSWKPH